MGPSYPVPSDEPARLEALRQFNILDTPPEEAFDRITRLAAHTFEVPVALITLVDADRQWHKSCFGVDIDEVDRELSFCTHTIVQDEVMVVSDLKTDERFDAHPFVTGEPGIRFYAGAPLVTDDGYAIGSLCLIDTEPNALSPDECDRLQDLAALAMDELDLRRQVAEREKAETEANRFFNSTLDLLFVTDAEGTFERVNPQVEPTLGYAPDDLVGRSFEAFVHPDDVDASRRALQRLQAGSEVVDVESRFRHRDGTYRLLEWRAAPDEAGDQIYAAARDVTERHERERKIRRREQELAEYKRFTDDILDAVDDVFYVLDDDGYLQRWNQALSEVTGYGDDDIQSMHGTDFFAPSDRPRIAEAIQAVFEEGRVRVKVPFQTQSGELVPHEFVAARVRHPDGFHVLAGIGRDITERQQAREKLEQSERRVTRVLESISDAFFATDTDQNFTYVNAEAERLLDRSRDELIGENVWDQFPQAEGTIFQEQYAAAFESGQTKEFDAYYPPLNTWFHVKAYPFDEGLSVHFNDVTQEKEAKQALKQERDLLDRIMATSAAALAVVDMQGRIVFANERVEEMLGLEQGGDLGCPRESFHWVATENGEPEMRFEATGEQLPGNPFLVDQVEADEAPVFDVERRIERNGEERILMANAAPLFDDEGRVVRAVVSIDDVTERRRAAAELEASEQRFRSLVSNLPGFVYRCTYDEAWRTIYMSEGFEQVCGHPSAEYEDGRTFKDVVVEEDLPQIRDEVRAAVEQQSSFDMEYRVRTDDGAIRWVQDLGSPAFDEDGKVQWLDGVMFDITERKEAEERLRLLETAMEDTPESVLITDAQLDRPGPRIVYVNRGFEKMSGYTKEEAIGQTPRILQGPETDRDLLDDLRDTIGRGEPWEGKTINYRKDGTPFFIEWTISTVRDPEEGDITHYVAVQRDVTERRRRERALQESEKKYRSVVNNVKEVVFRTDAQGRWSFLNPAWEDLLGYDVDESLEEPAETIVHPDDRELHRALFAAVLHGTSDAERDELRYVTAAGKERWMEIFVIPTHDEDGTVVGATGTLYDIHKRREAEERMRAALEKERELRKLKSQFVSMASHELRTPLATIQSSAELAELFAQQGNETKTDKHLGRIRDNVDRMTRLLEDVLVFGRAESGRLPFKPEPVQAAPMIRDLVRDLAQGRGAQHDIDFSFDGTEAPVEADPQLIRLIASNLLSNAIKYSPAGSTVHVDVEQKQQQWQIRVADEGIGIPDDEIDHLFEPFRRAENTDGVGGTGLGLAILKEAVELHQGDVEVASVEGEGTTFTVTLPTTQPTREAAEEEASARP